MEQRLILCSCSFDWVITWITCCSSCWPGRWLSVCWGATGSGAGKLNLWATGNNLDLLDTFLLFGDPATQIPIYYPTAVTHTISGNTGIGNASLFYIDGPLQSATSAPDGSYALTVSDSWTGTITPYKPGYAFTPTVISITVPVTEDLTGQNFTATVLRYLYLLMVKR